MTLHQVMTALSEASHAAETSIRSTLGAEYAEAYTKALSILRSNDGEELERAEKATEILVGVLGSVTQDKAQTLGFAELLLGYAEALMVFVRNEAGSEEAVLGPQVPKGLPAVDGIDGGVKVRSGDEGAAGKNEMGEKKMKSEEGDVDEFKVKESAVKSESERGNGDDAMVKEEEGKVAHDDEEEEIEEDNSELVWEQLEAARMVFEAHRSEAPERLVYVYEKLGDFLMAMDKSKDAAAEYGKAAAVESETVGMESRLLALLCHRQYLALRKDDQVEALRALRAAIDVFENHVKKKEDDAGKDAVEEDKDVLKEMRDECRAFESTVEQAGLTKSNGTTATRGGSTGVTKVVPKPKSKPPDASEKITVAQEDGGGAAPASPAVEKVESKQKDKAADASERGVTAPNEAKGADDKSNIPQKRPPLPTEAGNSVREGEDLARKRPRTSSADGVG